MSQPHFLNGPYYQKLVEGQHPDPVLHDTYIDVEKVRASIKGCIFECDSEGKIDKVDGANLLPQFLAPPLT